MENQQGNNPIESIMSTTMENLKDMIDVNVVVGDAVETGAGATIIPISRVSFGFVAGGGEYGAPQPPKLPFAGGAGTGVSVNPMGFLVVSDGHVKLMPAQHYAPIDRVIEMLPDLMSDIKSKLRCGCRTHPDDPEVSKTGLPNYSSMHKYDTASGMYITPDNVPSEVCDESARGMHTTTQGSFEDPKVKARMEKNGDSV